MIALKVICAAKQFKPIEDGDWFDLATDVL